MAWLVRVLKWFWKLLEIFAPLAPLLWAVTIYGGLALSLVTMIQGTVSLVSGFSEYFNVWADNFSASIVEFFQAVSSNSFFAFLSYIVSLDVPIEWFRDCGDMFIRFWLSWVCGIIVGVVEICVVVLGVMWVRSRVKMAAAGLGGDNSGG